MNHRAALRNLAGRIGIETLYTDALGQKRAASDETLSAVLAALGLAGAPAQATAELEALERALPFGLAPAQLLHAEDPRPGLALRGPLPAGRIAWTCRLEDGEECSGVHELPAGNDSDRLTLPLPGGLPLGYHRLALDAGEASTELSLIVAPARCYLPAALQDNRGWGMT